MSTCFSLALSNTSQSRMLFPRRKETELEISSTNLPPCHTTTGTTSIVRIPKQYSSYRRRCDRIILQKKNNKEYHNHNGPRHEIHITHSCLIVPIVVAAWWFYTKRFARRTVQKVLLLLPPPKSPSTILFSQVNGVSSCSSDKVRYHEKENNSSLHNERIKSTNHTNIKDDDSNDRYCSLDNYSKNNNRFDMEEDGLFYTKHVGDEGITGTTNSFDSEEDRFLHQHGIPPRSHKDRYQSWEDVVVESTDHRQPQIPKTTTTTNTPFATSKICPSSSTKQSNRFVRWISIGKKKRQKYTTSIMPITKTFLRQGSKIGESDDDVGDTELVSSDFQKSKNRVDSENHNPTDVDKAIYSDKDFINDSQWSPDKSIEKNATIQQQQIPNTHHSQGNNNTVRQEVESVYNQFSVTESQLSESKISNVHIVWTDDYYIVNEKVQNPQQLHTTMGIKHTDNDFDTITESSRSHFQKHHPSNENHMNQSTESSSDQLSFWTSSSHRKKWQWIPDTLAEIELFINDAHDNNINQSIYDKKNQQQQQQQQLSEVSHHPANRNASTRSNHSNINSCVHLESTENHMGSVDVDETVEGKSVVVTADNLPIWRRYNFLTGFSKQMSSMNHEMMQRNDHDRHLLPSLTTSVLEKSNHGKHEPLRMPSRSFNTLTNKTTISNTCWNKSNSYGTGVNPSTRNTITTNPSENDRDCYICMDSSTTTTTKPNMEQSCNEI